MGPAPVTVSRTPLAGTVSCVLNGSGAFEPPSTLASRSLGVIGIAVPPASSWSSFREDGSSSRHQEAVSLLRGLDGGTS
jgi:hypothetical protein